ncbi:MAG TPA: radical SAM protein [Planctomycetota bacterium]|nr:radical SAM protein [Planctomycetota bacterium]
MNATRYLWNGASLLRSFVSGGISHVNVQITNRCNMRCGFCTFPDRAVAPRDELELADWKRVAKTLARAGSVVCSIEGGEPLLRADAPAIVEAFAEHHFPWFYTNGWFVTEAVARDLWRAGAVEIGVSIDYATREKHDESRRLAGAFEHAVTAIRTLSATAPRGGRQVHVLSILLHDNLDELEPLLELSRSLGVRHMLTFLSTYGIYRSGRAQQPPREKVAGRILALKKRFPHLAIFKSYVEGIDRFLDGRPPPCGAGLHAMNIDHLGRVSPCIELAHIDAANIAREPWFDVKRKLAAVEEPRTCERCWTLCRGSSEAMCGRPRLGDWKDFVTEFVL